MGIAAEIEGGRYQQELARQGHAGTQVGNAAIVGFMDGFGRGHKLHAGVVVEALQVLIDGFKEPVSIKSAREQVEQLQLAIKSGSGL